MWANGVALHDNQYNDAGTNQSVSRVLLWWWKGIVSDLIAPKQCKVTI